MRATLISVTLAALHWAADVAAQPGRTSPTAPPAAAEPVSTVEAGVQEDANSGRTWLSPTALTPPAGTFSIQSSELFIIGASYAFTDRFVVSANTLIPVGSEVPLILLTTLKLKVADLGRVKLAAHANLNYFGDLADDEDESFGTALLGAVGTICIDRGCHSILNGYVGAGFLLETDGDQEAVPLLLSAALVSRLGRRLKLVLEANSGVVVGEVNDVSEGGLVWYGLRFTSSAIGVDLGLVKPFCEDCDTEEFPIGVPWLNFTYRAL